MTIAQWAERHRVLDRTAQESGPLRLRRTPYLVPLLEWAQDPEVERIDFCKSAQIGGTEAVISILGYYAHMEPCPIMYVLADQETATYINRDRIQPMFGDSAMLEELLTDAKRATKLELVLRNGAHITMAWASSVARLASRPVRVVLFDEVDKPGYYQQTKEADPISLGIQRTTTFWDRLIVTFSTPTVEAGNIWRALNSCDVIYDWHVPCPRCGVYQPLRFSATECQDFQDGQYRADDGTLRPLGQVVWEGGRDATDEQIEAAGYRCGSCGAVWDTIEKNNAVELGKAVPRQEPKRRRRIGYHVTRLYSLLGDSGDLAKIVRQFLASRGDPGLQQDFVNNVLAEPYRQVVVASQADDVLRARADIPPRKVPEGAVALTAGVDVQLRGFWYVVRAWANDHTSWLIDYGHLADWNELERLLFGTAYPAAWDESKEMRIWRAAIDTGGGDAGGDVSLTESVYWWLRDHAHGRGCLCFGIKGASNPLPSYFRMSAVKDRSPSGKAMPGGLRIVLLDGGKLKDAFHYALQQAMEAQPRGAYLHRDTGEDYARQITAEEKRVVKRGLMQWVQVRKDNHLLDCEVMALAVAHPEWPAGGGVSLVREPIGLVPRGTMSDVTGPKGNRPPAPAEDEDGDGAWWLRRRDSRVRPARTSWIRRL
jgi:phage terminase large subunit GpA-like protein